MNLPEDNQTGFLAHQLGQVFPELTKVAVQPPLEEEMIIQK